MKLVPQSRVMTIRTILRPNYDHSSVPKPSNCRRFYLNKSTWRTSTTNHQLSWGMQLQQHLVTINGEYIDIEALLFHWYAAVETWMRKAFWSHFDKIANFSWSKQALPFISRLVYGLKITPKALCM